MNTTDVLQDHEEKIPSWYQQTITRLRAHSRKSMMPLMWTLDNDADDVVIHESMTIPGDCIHDFDSGYNNFSCCTTLV